ncbi:hypothetical protein BC828DRAFT_372614 [Blastocladiella britannica]|nr:hypothetical protein BC828DRAFT_372614 [Blastocladiella britannica]
MVANNVECGDGQAVECSFGLGLFDLDCRMAGDGCMQVLVELLHQLAGLRSNHTALQSSESIGHVLIVEGHVTVQVVLFFHEQFATSAPSTTRATPFALWPVRREWSGAKARGRRQWQPGRASAGECVSIVLAIEHALEHVGARGLLHGVGHREERVAEHLGCVHESGRQLAIVIVGIRFQRVV